MRTLNTSKVLALMILSLFCVHHAFAATLKTMYFTVTNNMPKDNACIYASPNKTLTVFYPGAPASGLIVDYKTTSPILKAISDGAFPVNLVGFQENTGIPCPDVYAMYPHYTICKPDSYTNGRDNSCLNVFVDSNCNVTLNDSCLNPGYDLQKGISTDGSYRYQVIGKSLGRAEDGSPKCQLTVNWLKNWNEPQNAATLENHACK